jgi:hypothetical protein
MAKRKKEKGLDMWRTSHSTHNKFFSLTKMRKCMFIYNKSENKESLIKNH